jgi:hypothetical protein
MLLDAAAMTPHLGDLFAVEVSGVRVRYLDYEPGAALYVQYDAVVGDGDALRVEAHASADGRDWQLYAYPHDPALPMLGASAEILMGALDLPVANTAVTRLAWVPNRRAVLRCGDVIVKLYADPAELGRAERALRAIAGVIPTAALVASRPDRGAVAQEVLGGRPLDRDDAPLRAADAAAVLHRLHAAKLDGLDDLGPAALLAASRRPASLVAFGVPSLADRIDVISDHLATTVPAVPWSRCTVTSTSGRC